MQRLRGLQMAMVYGHMLGQAISEYKALAAQVRAALPSKI